MWQQKAHTFARPSLSTRRRRRLPHGRAPSRGCSPPKHLRRLYVRTPVFLRTWTIFALQAASFGVTFLVVAVFGAERFFVFFTKSREREGRAGRVEFRRSRPMLPKKM